MSGAVSGISNAFQRIAKTGAKAAGQIGDPIGQKIAAQDARNTAPASSDSGATTAALQDYTDTRVKDATSRQDTFTQRASAASATLSGNEVDLLGETPNGPKQKSASRSLLG